MWNIILPSIQYCLWHTWLHTMCFIQFDDILNVDWFISLQQVTWRCRLCLFAFESWSHYYPQITDTKEYAFIQCTGLISKWLMRIPHSYYYFISNNHVYYTVEKARGKNLLTKILDTDHHKEWAKWVGQILKILKGSEQLANSIMLSWS